MKSIFSIVAGIIAGAAWTSAAPALSGSNIQTRAADDLASRTRVKVHPSQIRLLPDSDYNVWQIADVTSAEYTANGLDFTLSAGGTIALEGDWNKVNYRQFVAKLGERLVGTAITTHEDSVGGPITLTIAGLPEGEHSLLTWHNGWQRLAEIATLSISVNGEEIVTVRFRSFVCDNITRFETYTSDLLGSHAVRCHQQLMGCRHLVHNIHSIWFRSRRNRLHAERCQ